LQEKSIKAKSVPERKSDEKESCFTGFSACGGSRKRHSTIPPQCDPRGAFLSYRNEVSYTIKKEMQNCISFSKGQYVASADYS